MGGSHVPTFVGVAEISLGFHSKTRKDTDMKHLAAAALSHWRCSTLPWMD
jgi:hypothetical protein